MSSANSVSSPLQSGRRSHARRRMERLTYVDFGPDNGAILVDLGEGGLAFQSVIPVSVDQAILLKFKLPGENNPIEGYAEVAWLNESRKGGGLRFMELNANAYAQIRGWAGPVTAPETGAAYAPTSSVSNSAQPDARRRGKNSTATTEPELTQGGELHTQISEAVPAGENAPIVFPSHETTDVPSADGLSRDEVSADPGTLLASESAAQVTAAADSSNSLSLPTMIDPPATPADPGSSAEERASPIIVAGASDSALPDGPESNIEDAVEADLSDVTHATSEVPQIAVNTPSAALHASPETEPRMHAAPASGELAGHGAVTRTRGLESEFSSTAHAAPARGVRPPAPESRNDLRNLASAQKRPRKPLPPRSESSLPPADRQDSNARASLLRQSQKPAPGNGELEISRPSRGDESRPQAMLASQALKLGVGAAAGVCLVLALFAGIPFLRTRVQATADAKARASNLASAPAFQVEVADLDNRRWTLKSGGDAGSPFTDAPSRRERQSEASSAARNESGKSSRAGGSDDSSNTPETPQPKLSKPGELALSRPHTAQTEAASAQLVAPSIFDGITPPIGSVSDRLAAGGPEAPGIVPPEGQPGARNSALQAAVLVQRVPPVYPKAAVEAHVTGDVRISATIGRDGVPRDLKVINGDLRLVDAARAAISQWRYRPATLGGQPIETQIVVSVGFELKAP